MTPRKITIIRELTVGEEIGQRISYINYDEDTGNLIRPENLDADCQQEWDRIMAFMQNFNGEGKDLRHIIDGPGLIDHLLNTCGCDQTV